MPNEGRVYFALFGSDFDPDHLHLGISPTERRRRGNPRPKQSSWILSTDKVVSDVVDVYSMSSALIESLIPHEARIVEAVKAHKLEAILEVVLTISTDESVSTPAIGFDRKLFRSCRGLADRLTSTLTGAATTPPMVNRDEGSNGLKL